MEGPAIHKRDAYIANGDSLGRYSDRRTACRYPVITESAALGWWDDTEFHCVKATLKNLSLEGALTSVESPPPADATVWICLGGGAPTDWVEASVISVARVRRGPFQVRLKFRTPCPYDFFDSAIHNANSKSQAPQHVSKEFDGRYWK